MEVIKQCTKPVVVHFLNGDNKTLADNGIIYSETFDETAKKVMELACGHEVEIKKIFDEHRSRYGSLRITKVLEQNGIKVNRKRVARLMRMMNLSPKGTNYKYKRCNKRYKKIKCNRKSSLG